MNKNVLIGTLVLIIIIMGIVLFAKNGNLQIPFSNNGGTIINTNADDKAKVDTSSGAVLTPPALPN